MVQIYEGFESDQFTRSPQPLVDEGLKFPPECKVETRLRNTGAEVRIARSPGKPIISSQKYRGGPTGLLEINLLQRAHRYGEIEYGANMYQQFYSLLPTVMIENDRQPERQANNVPDHEPRDPEVESEVEYQKRRRREISKKHYQLNADKKKNKRGKKRQPQNAEETLDWERAEADATNVLTQMLTQKRAVSVLPQSSDEELAEDLIDTRPKDLDLRAKLDADWKRFLQRQIDKGEPYVEESDSQSTDDEGNVAANTGSATARQIPETSGHQKKEYVLSASGRLKMRMCTPPPGSPPPEELEERIPSFYDKLWARVERPRPN
ncbi:hypothetical protein B0H17DRAFT_1146873 [Mycena rosella]|uniref:Uncharacterized protein n=1 Tax=Mycena rosella TaxID=1033263 RepID=A0AAD7G4E1_MYCRO|nr:hypothetical protein B0H17DRAFT_1146873 [Mycena rosella]